MTGKQGVNVGTLNAEGDVRMEGDIRVNKMEVKHETIVHQRDQHVHFHFNRSKNDASTTEVASSWTENPGTICDKLHAVDKYVDALHKIADSINLATGVGDDDGCLPFIPLKLTERRKIENAKDKEPKYENIDASLGSAFEKLHRKYVGLFGPAGYGKSTAAQHMCKLFAKKPTAHDKGVVPVLLRLKTFNKDDANEKIKWPNIVEKTRAIMGLNSSEKKLLKEWMQENKDQVMFVIDGLDEFLEHMKDNWEPRDFINLDKVRTNTLISSILAGCGFEDNMVVVASRDEAKNELKGKMIPKRIIQVGGWDEKEIRTATELLSPNKHERIIEVLLKNPSAYGLCANPAMCQFVVSHLEKHPEYDIVNSTHVLTKVVLSMLESKHLHEKNRAKEVLVSLAMVSFKTLVTQKTNTITVKDLDECNVKKNDISWLSESSNNHHGEASYQFLAVCEKMEFKAKMLHEVFAAIAIMFINEFDKDFCKLVESFSYDKDKVDIFKCCFGLMNETVQTSMEDFFGKIEQDKIDHLKRELEACVALPWYRRILPWFGGSQVIITNHWFKFAFECNDQNMATLIARKFTDDLSFSTIPMKPVDIEAISYVMLQGKCTATAIDLSSVNLNKTCLELLKKGIEGLDNLRRLDLSKNTDIGNDIDIMKNIIPKVKTVILHECNIGSEGMQAICSGILQSLESRLETLNLSYNPLNESVKLLEKDILDRIKKKIFINLAYSDRVGEDEVKIWHVFLKEQLRNTAATSKLQIEINEYLTLFRR